MRRYLFGLLLALALIAGIAGLILGATPFGIALILFGILLALLARILQAGLLAEESAVVEAQARRRDSQ